MIVHARYAVEHKGVGRLIITSPDTDVAVLCVFHNASLQNEEFWFHTGTGKKRRFIPIYTVAQKLSEEFCKVLPAFHSRTGCDSNSAPLGCGKKAAFASLKENIDRFTGLSELGNSAASSEISEELLDTAIEFFCSLYVMKGITVDINALRYKLRVKKGLESSRLPPTKDCTILHVHRANYQCHIWKCAQQPILIYLLLLEMAELRLMEENLSQN